MKAFAKQGLAEARQKFAEDGMTVEIFENESEFWLSCDACDLCSNTQMCSGHYEWFFQG